MPIEHLLRCTRCRKCIAAEESSRGVIGSSTRRCALSRTRRQMKLQTILIWSTQWSGAVKLCRLFNLHSMHCRRGCQVICFDCSWKGCRLCVAMWAQDQSMKQKMSSSQDCSSLLSLDTFTNETTELVWAIPGVATFLPNLELILESMRQRKLLKSLCLKVSTHHSRFPCILQILFAAFWQAQLQKKKASRPALNVIFFAKMPNSPATLHKS